MAGLVGIGLSKLFEASGLENKEVGKDVALANSMGLFLQKTNIIRDYLEDTIEDRCFWPEQVGLKNDLVQCISQHIYFILCGI